MEDQSQQIQSSAANVKVKATEVLSLDDLAAAVELLEKVAENRALLAHAPEDMRRRLVMAAGRTAKPDRFQIRKMTKAMRREKKHQEFTADVETKNSVVIRQTREQPVFQAPNRQEQFPVRHLHSAQRCYVCKAPYTKLHFFYDSMCEACADFNYEKRFQTADLRGRTALLTGGRVKIGYQAGLMLLRAGASLIVSTRFPVDAARRYLAEPDSSQWRHRLKIFGLDLRHAPSVEIFARYIQEKYQTLDFLINNAAQTVRRPRGFYSHMIAGESENAGDPLFGDVLEAWWDCKRSIASASTQDPALPPEASEGLLAYSAAQFSTLAPGLAQSAQMSQIPVLPEDLNAGLEIFPAGKLDADLQQVDLRTNNSWRMRLGDVSTAELLEIQLINAVAPFILCSKLKPLLVKTTGNHKHIVNVSAMEGKFSRYTKTDKHPHTNMAKAALNMMTQTSAPDYVKDGIHMNAVDTGWVTDEDPIQHATRKKSELGFQPPLDIVDGAARILDPIFAGLNSGTHIWGQFLKDYKSTSW